MAEKAISLEQFKDALKAIRNSTISEPDLSVKFVENAPNLNAAEGEPGYIQGRTHWSEYKTVEILPETTFAFNAETGEGIASETSIGLKIGGMYKVTYNGTVYECMASLFDIDGISCVFLGNASLTGGVDTNEPFALIEFPSEMVPEFGFAVSVVDINGATQATIKIIGDYEYVHALDKKYIAKDILSNLIPVIDLSHYSLTPVALGEKITVSPLDENTANKLKSDLSIGIAKVRFTRMDQSNEMSYEVTGWVQHITQGLISVYSFLSDYSITGLKVYLCLMDNGINNALEVKISL